jgi:hypothetical protein
MLSGSGITAYRPTRPRKAHGLQLLGFCRVLVTGLVFLSSTSLARGDDGEFFEKKIRPILAEHCYKCHSQQAKKVKGGLLLDSRAAVLKGGDGGSVVVPRRPEKSRLIEAVSYTNVDLRMPPRGKLSDALISDLTHWVKLGLPWPQKEVVAAGPKRATFDLDERRRSHWAWQPIQSRNPPMVSDSSWPRDPIDAFILAKLEEKRLRPSPRADRRTLLRRVYFDLIGLPPTPAEVEAFVHDSSPNALAAVVDRLLASPQFGERWARHWLDLVRYAETRGHEYDYLTPNAYQYRDYVIRALNADVPYNQFVTEHIAGNLLQQPRLHPVEHFNESILGTGFWFLGEELHSPVDVAQDEADRLDNQIDVMGKTFLGLTIACARCHDHKFDAISSKDYYALFGFLESSGYRQARFDSIEHNRQIAGELAELREKSRPAIYRWLAAVVRAQARAMSQVTDEFSSRVRVFPEPDHPIDGLVIDYAHCGSSDWMPDGVGFGLHPTRPGEVQLSGDPSHPVVRLVDYCAAEYDPAWDTLSLAPHTENDPGALGRLLHPGSMIRTPTFTVTGKVCYLVKGTGQAYAAVDLHKLINGPLHAQLVLPIHAGNDFQWICHDLSAYKGERAHIEFTAGFGSHFAVAMVLQADKPRLTSLKMNSWPASRLLGLAELLEKDEIIGHPQAAALARFVNAALHLQGMPPASPVPALGQFLSAQRAVLNRAHAVSRLAPAILDGDGVDEQVFIRGSHKTKGERVPRRFLEALAGPAPLPISHGSGRLELARQMTDPKINPLLARVMVNRIWHHLFGRGIVPSVDNFGLLGDRPTHPELLDYLANRFIRQGWSVKKMIREVVLSRTYQMASTVDPDNVYLQGMRMRRLEGEAIRDAMLAVSGRLDLRQYGRQVPIRLNEFQDGRGRPPSGPLDGDGRRSIYLAVRRNFLSPMLLAFDMPIPFSTIGRRTVSNVPAQALILMNDPFVHQQAAVWARRLIASGGTPHERIASMYNSAFSRPPRREEEEACLAFIDQQMASAAHKPDELTLWTDLAHVLFNAKEFIFLN